MRIDLYTKIVLTIIAACVVWMAVGGPIQLAPVHAHANRPDAVTLSGWIDANGTSHRLPPVKNGGPSAQPIPVDTFQR
jgi:hypothetical protein